MLRTQKFDRTALARYGVVYDEGLQLAGYLDPTLAQDAQPVLVTQVNAGIPNYLSNWVDPRIIDVIFSPMKAAQIAGETKKGDWTTTVATFPVVESDGQVSAYGDFNTNGSVEVNANFPQRQSFHYQTYTQWGEKELANAALAKLDWAFRVNQASILLLNKYQNQTYFFGVAGLQTYGLLNDPALYAPIAPTAAWNASSTSADSVYEDIRRLFVQLQTQSNGTVDMETKLTLAMSPVTQVAMAKTNQFGLNVQKLVDLNFPNLTVKTAVEYGTAAGQLVQMIADTIEGQETATAAFTEKMRAHAIVVDTSSWKQKKSQGTFGTVLYRPFGIAQMIGV